MKFCVCTYKATFFSANMYSDLFIFSTLDAIFIGLEFIEMDNRVLLLMGNLLSPIFGSSL